MAFEGLTEKLTNTFNRLRGKGRLSEADVREAMREVRLALLDADVSYPVVKDFIDKVTQRAVGSDVLKALSPAQTVIKIVNEELTDLMGGKASGITFASHGPTVIMTAGLQGAGKTTNVAKLAGHFKREGRRPLLVACDVYRPAAIRQLQIVGEQVGVPVFEMGQIDPVDIAVAAVDHAKKHGNDLVFLDTAGRLHVDEELMGELRRIKDAVHPNEILLVVDAMIGQDAVNVAKSFDEALDLTGVILTKLDGDSRGGAALSIKATIGKPIKFAGMGEKLDQIEVFHPDRMASRILGMGDMLSLIEKAEANYNEAEAAKLEEKIRKNRLTLTDFYDQLVQLQQMGSLSDVMAMMPGMKGQIDASSLDDKILVRTKAIIQSMTVQEREEPSILNASRKKRIAAGSGTTVQQVNQLLKQFEMMQNMTRQMTGGRMPKGMMNGSMPVMPGMGGGHSRGRTRPNKKRKKKR